MGSSSSKAAGAAGKAASKLSSKPTPAARKYPTRSPRTTSSSATNSPADAAAPIAPGGIGSTVHPNSKAPPPDDAAINTEAPDPDLNPAYQARLQQLGAVQPNPTLSNSSTFNSPASSTNPQQEPSSFQPSASTPSQSVFPSASSNPAVSLLTARYRLAEEAEREFEEIGKRGAKGRQFVDVFTLKQVLVMRERGMMNEQIERTLELKEGVVGRLGRRGVVGVAR
ncbi:Uncharacterized protein BP5553_03142 [Venustampulla echinocandica]|uniref:Helix-turn-helix domain-containing protein n=1 Tax=Venustampulla echinocandica TaxID=2656787 RepID=A0A370TTE1_9HELO|nr:Uncharacterized protein BP5553_03142 [Venustampulla echinocandica]RDL38802.1 Uncharacterized protein BP5553_03142 [Venustampulla echinocandica]